MARASHSSLLSPRFESFLQKAGTARQRDKTLRHHSPNTKHYLIRIRPTRKQQWYVLFALEWFRFLFICIGEIKIGCNGGVCQVSAAFIAPVSRNLDLYQAPAFSEKTDWSLFVLFVALWTGNLATHGVESNKVPHLDSLNVFLWNNAKKSERNGESLVGLANGPFARVSLAPCHFVLNWLRSFSKHCL